MKITVTVNVKYEKKSKTTTASAELSNDFSLFVGDVEERHQERIRNTVKTLLDGLKT